MISTVLFDLDGTLVDSAPDMATAIRQMLEQLHLPSVTDHHVRGWIGNGRWKLVERVLRHVLQQPTGELDTPLYQQANALYFTAYQNSTHQHTHPYEGAPALLQFLHGKVQLGLVTNKDHSLAMPLLQHLGIHHYFDIVLGGDSCAERKPKPGPILDAMTALNAAPATTIMVGDSNNDFDAAQAAKIESVGLTHGYHRQQTLRADILFDDFAACLNWFKARIN